MTQPPGTAANNPDRIEPGVRLADRYLVQQVVGYGGMATVYHGRDTLLDRDVAIKVLNQRLGPGDADRDGFLREARAAASLSHPGIAGTYDAGVYSDWPYIVMEFVPGGSLKQVIDRRAPLPPDEAVSITIMLAEALDYGHRRDVVHCDVKPQNVLMDAEGQPKLVDFGISQSVAMTAAYTATVTGTAGYVAPEQLEGLALDGRADVYSLGTVLYQLLTRSLPFEAPNLAALATRRLVAEPRPIRDLNPALPLPLAEIVMRCLERDRSRRYASAGELAAALRAFRQGRPQTEPLGRSAADATQVWRRGGPAVTEVTTVPGARPVIFWSLAGVLAALLVILVVVLVVVVPGRGGSSGSVTVPQLANSTRIDQAAAQLHAAGLKVDVQLAPSDAPFGTVIGQSPAADAAVSKGDHVTLTVSEGSQP
jgi:serine/threonine-protein kinase